MDEKTQRMVAQLGRLVADPSWPFLTDVKIARAKLAGCFSEDEPVPEVTLRLNLASAPQGDCLLTVPVPSVYIIVRLLVNGGEASCGWIGR
jgi:hypothetical protein